MAAKLYVLLKQIHRLMVLIISALLTFMVATGLMLKYTVVAAYLPFIDMGLVRYLHGSVSIYFAVVLVIMMASGLYMYLFPILRRKPTPPAARPILNSSTPVRISERL